jgi:DNA-binding winged helix-turn-helix (wHTH) protein
MNTETGQAIVRFGEFEFDRGSGDLRRLGHRILIQDQPLVLLEMLIARAGTVVTRQELCQRLWPQAFVDFDNGLNNAVSRLRTALGDAATTPRFVETVGRRGYRFIAAVEVGHQRQAATPVRAWLAGDSGRIDLHAGPNVLGRRGPDVLELASSTVSRRHARITIDESSGSASIEDLGSKNGTFVGEHRITSSVTLADGDSVRIGSLTLRFTLVRASEETRTASVGD